MTPTPPKHSRRARIAARIGMVLTAMALALGITAGTTLADTLKYSGDFSWRATQVKRLANCASTHWYNGTQQAAGSTGDASTGSKLTACDGAGSDSYWDGVHLLAADTLTMDGRKVGYRSDASCPPSRGFQFIKCWYVGGKAKGNPVINVSIIATGLGGQDVAVDWYYL